MDKYTIQEILERVRIGVCKDIVKRFDGVEETLRIKIINKFGWDNKTCHYAALNGYLECLKYAHENGCPWDEDTCFYASNFGHLECLKYATEQWCSIEMKICLIYARNNECKKYLESLIEKGKWNEKIYARIEWK